MDVKSLDWNWDRAIYVNREITNEFVADLIPEVLKLKQAGSAPITVGIDSVGGSVDAAEQLLKVLQSPDQKGDMTTVITVALGKAYSAAACLLAMGDYAVAMPSAKILFHDVRLGEVYDVTPTKAQRAARQLSRENDRIASLLSQPVVRRLAWNFIDLEKNFANAKATFPSLSNRVNDLTAQIPLQADSPRLDLPGFICSIYSKTGPVGDSLVKNTLEHLTHWRKLDAGFNTFKDRNKPDLAAQALFRDDNPLTEIISASFPDKAKFTWIGRDRLKDDIALFLLLALSRAIQDEQFAISEITIATLTRDFAFFRQLRERDHADAVIDILTSTDVAMFGFDISSKKDEHGKYPANFVMDLFSQVEVFWAFTLILCRYLLTGDHSVSLTDARYLGLVDEVVGHDRDLEPRRLFTRRSAKKSEAST